MYLYTKEMVFYRDIRASPVEISVNANFVRQIIEETTDREYSEDYIEELSKIVEQRVSAQLASDNLAIPSLGRIIWTSHTDSYEDDTNE